MSARVIVVAILTALVGTGARAQGPIPVSPGGQSGVAVVSDRCPTFHWTAVEEVESLDLVVYRVSKDEATAPPERVLGVTLPGAAQGWTPSLGQCLESGTRYAWSVGVDGEWSEASLFEISATPAIAEIEQALRVLRRYLREPEAEAAETPARREHAERPDQRLGSAQRSGHESTADQEAGLVDEGAVAAQAPVPSTSPSLVVDDQIHLGSSSDILRSGALFLWTDGGPTSTSANLAVGVRALESTTGGTNTAVGHTALRSNTSGSRNSALGEDALLSNTTGRYNSALGEDALRNNTEGERNSAFGEDALYANTTASNNSAFGENALRSNTSGGGNTAVGQGALRSNTSGGSNSAFGRNALHSNTTSTSNSAFGSSALYDNAAGAYNSAFGASALTFNTSGSSNSAFGWEALRDNLSGDSNSAFGQGALRDALGGDRNTAIGRLTLIGVTGGYDNIALGFKAGSDLGPGNSDNILIGNYGTGSDFGAIRIGDSSQSRAFIAGVHGTTTGEPDAVTVLVDSEGQLGTTSSSRAVKRDIRAIGELSRRVQELQPVAFRYRQHVAANPDTPMQFGLIAEEVAEVFPELVVYDETEQPFTVKYHLLSSLLLSELQKQHREVRFHRWALAVMLIAGVALTVGRSRFG